MDVSAEAEISRALDVKPYKLDPAGAVPIHRPRFCWSNMDLAPMEGVDVEEKDRWWEVRIQNEYPELEQWLEEGAQWPGFSNGTILPTCMKCIKRSRPPPAPAGIDRVGYDGKMRWIADDFRFPPINMMIVLLSGLGRNGGLSMLRKGNSCMVWVLSTPVCAGALGTSKMTPKGLKTRERPWLGIRSVVTPLFLLLHSFATDG